MVPGLEMSHSGADVDDDAGALVAQDRWKEALRVGARQRVFVGVADAGGFDLDQDFPFAWAVQLHGVDGQGLPGFKGDGGTNVHGVVGPFVWR